MAFAGAWPRSRIYGLFQGTRVEVQVLPGGIGSASALKLAYSSYQKASRVLAAVAYALAADHGVEGELLGVAAGRSTSYLAEPEYFPEVAARAWRWAPEMREVAEALEASDLPAELAQAAELVMGHWGTTAEQTWGIGGALAALRCEETRDVDGPAGRFKPDDRRE